MDKGCGGIGIRTLGRIVQNSPNGVIVVGEDIEIRYINPSAEVLTGVNCKDVLGKSFKEVYPQIDLGSKDITRVTIGERDLHVTQFSMEEDGKENHILLMNDLSRMARLVTELEKTKHLADELTSILEGSFDGMLVTDGEGNVLMVNKSYERITDITKDELMGKNMRDMINPVYMKNSAALVVIQEKQAVSLHHTTKHGRNIIVTGMPIFDEQGEVEKVVINARDITEIYELREELLKAKEMEKIYFQQMSESGKAGRQDVDHDLVVVSESMQKIFSLAAKLNNFNTTILILGESGSGKEEIARYIHRYNESKRDKPFVTINCSAIPEHLLESELFGYEKGAFTGASSEGKEGIFETANGGTLFLDEITELPLSLQPKLLRVLETREITRVGSTTPIPIDVRILAATNEDLAEKVEAKEFRKDLYYRLNVVQIKIPPLRERIEDIAPLSLMFLNKFNQRYGQNKKLTYDAIKEMERYPWPGNVRELRNVIERMVLVRNNEYLQILDLPWFDGEDSAESSIGSDETSLTEAVEALEKKILTEALHRHKSSRKMADALKIDQATVLRKMKKYGIKRDN